MPRTPPPSDDPADAIAASLARLRGRRGPRPWPGGPWEEGRGTHGGPHSRPGDGGWPWGGPHGHRGAPPWAGGPHGRMAGPARLRLLEALASTESLTVSEIAEAVGVDQPRATRLVQQSVEFGLVRREADPEDARRTRVVLTDQGRSILQGFRGERREAIQTALNGFTDAERTELARLLAKLADAWPGA